MAEVPWNESLILIDHPTVCSIHELRNFGETVPSTASGSPWGKGSNHAADIDEFKAHLRYCVEQVAKKYQCIREDSWMNKSVQRTALIVAYTSSYQVKTEEYLNQLGFSSSGPVKKLKHPDSDLTLWFMPSVDFLEAIKE